MKPARAVTIMLIISALPVLAGVARVSDLTGGGGSMDASMGSRHMPASLILHIVASAGFLILGALQFLPSSRQTAWHRRAGRVAAVLGIAGALSGVWMVLRLPTEPTAGPFLAMMRFGFSILWAGALIAGIVLARQRRLVSHRRWMVRGYAVAAGTGLQSLILLPYFFAFGVPSGLPSDVVILASWLITLAVGEWYLGTVKQRKAAA
jgi:hypothetical protein